MIMLFISLQDEVYIAISYVDVAMQLHMYVAISPNLIW